MFMNERESWVAGAEGSWFSRNLHRLKGFQVSRGRLGSDPRPRSCFSVTFSVTNILVLGNP